jgi:hypothetical protein
MGRLIKEHTSHPWQGKEIFLFSKMYRPALKSTQPPIQHLPKLFAQQYGGSDLLPSTRNAMIYE